MTLDDIKKRHATDNGISQSEDVSYLLDKLNALEAKCSFWGRCLTHAADMRQILERTMDEVTRLRVRLALAEAVCEAARVYRHEHFAPDDPAIESRARNALFDVICEWQAAVAAEKE